MKFRRQVPFDRYTVDFYCHAAKLVVELDGRQHEWFAGYGAGRTVFIERMGVRVIRRFALPRTGLRSTAEHAETQNLSAISPGQNVDDQSG